MMSTFCGNRVIFEEPPSPAPSNTSNLRHSRGAEVSKEKNIEPIETKRLLFDVTHLFEELLNAFD